MLAITNTFTVFAADKKNKGFKKLSKKIQKERDTLMWIRSKRRSLIFSVMNSVA
tara:strand:- start:334 stop:495 length:162 start_codon:yes stop_codon:yes gene_type:complete